MSTEKNTPEASQPHRCGSAQLAESRLEKRKDDTIISFVQGLDIFIAQATSANLGTASRILHEAKADLVYWAAKMNYYESDEENFINKHLYGSALFAASDFIERYSMLQKKSSKKVTNSINISDDTSAQCASTLVKNLRKTQGRTRIGLQK